MTTPPDDDDKPDTTSHHVVWEIDTLGIPPSSFSDVWGTDPDNVYAVGLIYLPDSLLPVNIMHWNGSAWSPVNYLEGHPAAIFGFNASDIWLVGGWQVDQNIYSLIGHWDGQNWTTWKNETFGQLYGIWGTSSSNLFAVGRYGLVLRYNGSSWIQEPTPSSMDLLDVWGSTSGDVYAAGENTATGEGIILRRTQNSWTTFVTGSVSPSDSVLYAGFAGIWFSTTSKIHAVGSLSYEYYDNKWVLSDIPYNYPGGNLSGLAAMNVVRGTTENDVFICGEYHLIIHWNGDTWNIYSSLFDKSKPSSLRGIWTKDKSVFIVGTENSRALAYRGVR